MPEADVATRVRSSSKYGVEKSMTFLRTSVMEIEEMETSQPVSAVPVSIASKELSTTLSSALTSLASSAAMSMSKPTILPSFWNSKGS
ncbi:hypothetical protein D3C73_1348220 [compost metagenome]